MDTYTEIANYERARRLWSEMLADPNHRIQSQMLRTHCQTSGWSLTAQDVYNNVTRTGIEALLPH